MDRVSRTGQPLVITKNGKPVAELRPYSGGRVENPFGLHRNLRITGDVIAPIAENDWEAFKEKELLATDNKPDSKDRHRISFCGRPVR